MLSHASLLLAQALNDNEQVKVIGPYAEQLVNMAGAKLNTSTSTANYPMADTIPSSLKNTLITAAELSSPLTMPYAVGKLATGSATTDSKSPVESWIESIAGNWMLIGVGTILGIAALVMSQHKNITKVIDTGTKIASKVAMVAA